MQLEICPYKPIVKSVWQNIRAVVLTYGQNEVRSAGETKVLIFP